MPPKFSAIPGAQGFQQSNPSVLSTVSLLGSLQVFDAAGGIQPLREKSLSLTAYLERLLKALPAFIEPSAFPPSTQSPTFTIITPSTPESRGAQLSLLFHPPSIMRTVAEKLKHRGVIGDEREPDVIRFAPVPLYNRYEDCRRTAEMLGEVLSEL
jgi:kynureninase